jgi:hypothetical protein
VPRLHLPPPLGEEWVRRQCLIREARNREALMAPFEPQQGAVECLLRARHLRIRLEIGLGVDGVPQLRVDEFQHGLVVAGDRVHTDAREKRA